MTFHRLPLAIAVSACLLGGGLLAAVAQAEVPVPLREAAVQAIESNPEVQARWHRYLAAEQDIGIARGGLRPQVDLSASVGRQYREWENRGSYNRGQVDLTLTQLLYDGMRTRLDAEGAARERLVRYHELIDQTQQTALAAVTAYEDVVRHRELLRLAEGNLDQHRRVQQQVDKRVTSGVGRRVDLEQINGRLALAEANVLTERANLHDVSARYLRVVGQRPPAGLPASALQAQALPQGPVPALELALRNNPALHAGIEQVAAAQASMDARRADFHPRVELRAHAGVVRNADSAGAGTFDGTGDRWGVELVLRQNLYAGGSTSAASRRAKELVYEAIDLRDKICVDLRQTLQIALNDSRKLALQLEALERHRAASERVRLAYREQFEIGQRTLLDVLDAENEYFEAGRAYVKAQHDRALAHARVWAATGELLSVLGVARRDLPTLDDLGAAPPAAASSAACTAVAALD